MADITIPHTFAAGAQVESTHVNDNLYNNSGSSLRVINGYLDSDNKAADTDWKVKSDHIRNQTSVHGRMVGLTGNLDYPSLIFPTSRRGTGDDTPIPGCSLEFYLPFDPSLVVLTWTIQGTNNQTMQEAAEVSEFRAFLDGTQLNSQFRVFPQSLDVTTKRYFRDRIWSGQAIQSGTTSMSAGWHTFEIRVFNSASNTRVRIRNAKVIYFK